MCKTILGQTALAWRFKPVRLRPSSFCKCKGAVQVSGDSITQIDVVDCADEPLPPYPTSPSDFQA